MLETEALRLSIHHGGAAWEAALVAAIGRQEARVALALEAHVRSTCEVLKKAGLG